MQKLSRNLAISIPKVKIFRKSDSETFKWIKAMEQTYGLVAIDIFLG